MEGTFAGKLTRLLLTCIRTGRKLAAFSAALSFVESW